jgi:hypothetical protein
MAGEDGRDSALVAKLAGPYLCSVTVEEVVRRCSQGKKVKMEKKTKV